MAPSTSYEINGCIVKENSHQSNVVQHINIEACIVKIIAPEFPDIASGISQHKELPAFFRSIYPKFDRPQPMSRQSENGPISSGGDTHNNANNSSKTRPAPQPSNGVSNDEDLLGSSCYDSDLPLCIKRYLSTGPSLRVLDVLSHEERKKVDTWRNTNERGILFVRRSADGEFKSDWTTDLTLELMVGITGENSAIQQHRPVLAHFCKQNADKKDWGSGGIIVQDFLTQLLRKSRTQARCPSEESDHSSRGSQGIVEDLTELWNHLEQCASRIRAKTIFVFLDNIDWMFDKMEKEDFARFIDRLEKFRRQSKSFETTIKVMVTCSKNSPAIETYLGDQGVFKLDLKHPPLLRLQGGTP